MLEAGLVLSRFVHYSSVLLLFGAVLFPLYGARAVQNDSAFSRSFKRLLLASALLALLSLIGWFLFAAATMAGDASAMVDASVLLTITKTMGFGKLWVGRLGLALVLPVTLLGLPSPVARWVALALSALLLISLAGTGHAQEPQVSGWQWHIIADGTHLLAAGAWLGALWPLLFALRTPEPEHAGALLLRFSVMGQLAVAMLLLSGLGNSWYLVGSVSELTTTAYGRLLSVKVLLFLAMLAFAAANRFWITPQFIRPLPQRDHALWLVRLRKHIMTEQLLGLLVLAVVSLLGTLQPAAFG